MFISNGKGENFTCAAKLSDTNERERKMTGWNRVERERESRRSDVVVVELLVRLVFDVDGKRGLGETEAGAAQLRFTLFVDERQRLHRRRIGRVGMRAKLARTARQVRMMIVHGACLMVRIVMSGTVPVA